MSLADKIINRQHLEENDYIEFGIDEVGIPVPKPLNSEYIVARIIAKSSVYYKINDTVFIDKERLNGKISNTTREVAILCGEPRIILWKDDSSRLEWRGVSSIIKKESMMIYARLLELAPEFDKRRIKVTDNLMWDCKKADFIIRGEE